MYHITIELIEVVPSLEKEWLKVADSGNKHDDGPIYEYVWIDGTREKTSTLLEQAVETLDLAAVIKAVNNL
jgi:hypothetical protein